MRKKDFKVSVVIPVFNEEGSLTLIVEKVQAVLEGRGLDYEIIVVDDGSRDNTLNLAKELHERNNKVNFISFSRNFGQQSALRAGLKYASGDCVISMDGDFQHPPDLLPVMVAKWEEGYDVVFTVRKDANSLPFLKRVSSRLFYILMNTLSDMSFGNGEADFRLLDRQAVEELNNLDEDAIFYRGIVKWLGFNQTGIEYAADERLSGKTKYSRKKMSSLALSGITGFSTKPLRISTFIGITIALMSMIYGVYALYMKIFTDNTVEGWTSVFFMVTLIGGIQLIMIGILGEYIGRIFMESKKRPHYIIREDSLPHITS